MKKGRVHYFCFAVDEKSTKKELIDFPSAQAKIDYVKECIKACGYDLIVVSNCLSRKGFFKGRKYPYEDEQHVFFSSFHSKYHFINQLSLLYMILQTVVYLLFQVKAEDKVLIYHSIYYIFPFEIISRIKKCSFMLEAEEIYAALSDQNKKYEEKESIFVNKADKYLLVNDLLEEKINIKDKDYVVSYGNYKLPSILAEKKQKDVIDVVYAGVIEQKRMAAYMAVKAAEFLDDRYRVHILGFGNPEDIETLNELMARINADCGFEKVAYHGSKSGNDYFQFLQSCDIALSCHTYDESMTESADYTFPSKIITYLANNLRVVTNRIRCLENSAFRDILYFYDGNEPKALADAINRVEMTDKYDSRSIIREMDNDFRKKIDRMLETIAWGKNDKQDNE